MQTAQSDEGRPRADERRSQEGLRRALRTITAAVSWALSLPGVTGLATPGDVRLLGMVVEAERHRVDPDDGARTLGSEPAYISPFVDMPI